jgi:hypothetical protein
MTMDEVYAFARAAGDSHNLLGTLMRDPEARTAVQRQMKRLNPKLVIPEIDSVDAVTAEIKKRDEEIAELKKANLVRDAKDHILEARRAVAAKYGLTDADMIEVEKLMTAEVDPIPSYDAAARVFRASQRDALPTSTEFAPPVFEMPEKDVWGAGIGKPAVLNQIALKEAYRAMNEVHQGKVAGVGPAFGPGS